MLIGIMVRGHKRRRGWEGGEEINQYVVVRESVKVRGRKLSFLL